MDGKFIVWRETVQVYDNFCLTYAVVKIDLSPIMHIYISMRSAGKFHETFAAILKRAFDQRKSIRNNVCGGFSWYKFGWIQL